MIIVILLIASLILLFWISCLFITVKDDWVIAIYNKVIENLDEIEKLKVKAEIKNTESSKFYRSHFNFLNVSSINDPNKRINILMQQNEKLQSGDVKNINMLDIPGYVILRKFDAITHNNIYRNLLMSNYELYGKKYANNKTKKVFSKLISYLLIGVSSTLIVGVLLYGLGLVMVGLAIASIGTLLVIVSVYAIYDELNDKVNKRRESISRQYPNVVSKLALLVTSGMVVDKAWKETAYSNNSQLYKEMQKTAEELNNLVSPELAYSSFISRCNTKETAKLASAILQNLSKGNSEIGILLKGMAKEAWLERKHGAKRDAEKANAKLLIPSMLLFLAILVMLMVPVAMNFSSL